MEAFINNNGVFKTDYFGEVTKSENCFSVEMNKVIVISNFLK